MILFLVGIATGFCLFGFAIGVWAKNFEQLQIIPMLIITPLTFLGGAFYSVKTLHEPFRTITLFNPIVHVISGFRWSFYSIADVPVWSSVRGHPGDHRRLHGGDRLDVPDRLPAQAVARTSAPATVAPSPWLARSKPCPSRFCATKSQLTMLDSTLDREPRPLVAIVDVISVLPHIEREQRHHALVHDRRVGVVQRGDPQLRRGRAPATPSHWRNG